MDFKNLHYQETPLLISNVWDVSSAKIAEKLGFQAIGTSSAAIASALGYQDGEEMTFEELLFFVRRIKASTQLPLTVDIENGYGKNPAEIAANIKTLVKLGISGVNLEDSRVDEQRKLIDAAEFADTIKEVVSLLRAEGLQIFMNIRTDAYLLQRPDGFEETEKRVALYDIAGADGIFIPCLTESIAISKLVNTTDLPVNLMCMPDLPGFEELRKLGVKRISMGNFLFENMKNQLSEKLSGIQQDQSFKSLFA